MLDLSSDVMSSLGQVFNFFYSFQQLLKYSEFM